MSDLRETNTSEWIEAKAWRSFYRSAPEKVVRELGLQFVESEFAALVIAAGVPKSLFNRAFQIRVQSGCLTSLDEICALFQAAGISDYMLQFAPDPVHERYEPFELGDTVQDIFEKWRKSRGFIPARRIHWIKALLRELPSPWLTCDKNGHLEVSEVAPSEASEAALVFVKSHSLPLALVPWFEAVILSKEWITKIVKTDGKIVGTSLLYVHEKVAWLGMGGTLTEYRNRGVQTALIQSRVQAAVRAGCFGNIFVETWKAQGDQHNSSWVNLKAQGFQLLYLRPNFVRTS